MSRAPSRSTDDMRPGEEPDPSISAPTHGVTTDAGDLDGVTPSNQYCS